MKTIFSFIIFSVLFSSFIFAMGIKSYPSEKNVVVFVSSSHPTTWTNGELSQFYLDMTTTQKTFNDIRLDVGTYNYTIETSKRNNQPGKINLDITVKFQDGSHEKKVDQQYSPGTTRSGVFTIEDFKSQSSGSPAGYGMIKVHLGRADHNTNLNYKITINKTGGINNSGNNLGSRGENVPTLNSGNNNADCNYSDLGSKSGNVIGNTVGKYKSDKKACKNAASVTVTKTDGSARTTILVYASNDENTRGSLVASDEFANGNSTGSKTIPLTGVKNKFITVELNNRSATNKFKYDLSISQ